MPLFILKWNSFSSFIQFSLTHRVFECCAMTTANIRGNRKTQKKWIIYKINITHSGLRTLEFLKYFQKIHLKQKSFRGMGQLSPKKRQYCATGRWKNKHSHASYRVFCHFIQTIKWQHTHGCIVLNLKPKCKVSRIRNELIYRHQTQPLWP